jgi:hypothetical protein
MHRLFGVAPIVAAVYRLANPSLSLVYLVSEINELREFREYRREY